MIEVWTEQLTVWPALPHKRLPEQMLVPTGPTDPSQTPEHVPDGIEPVPPPDLPSIVESVDRALLSACAALAIGVPPVRWFLPALVEEGQESFEQVQGFMVPGEWVIWVRASIDSPLSAARTAAHEAVHLWQDRGRGICLDELEHADREDEAERRAELLVPDRSYPRSIVTHDELRERRLRHQASRLGLRLMRMPTRNSGVQGGTYGVVDLSTAWVASAGPKGYGLDLDSVEAWLGKRRQGVGD